MEFNIYFVLSGFITLFLIYCLVLFIKSVLKSNPLDYLKILDLESDFKKKNYKKLNKNNETILLQAIKYGAETLALDMIKTGKIDIKKTANDGTSAFFYAVICNNFKLVKALLNAGEEIEPKKCGKFGSPLLWAARSGSIEMIDYFLENKADINRQTTGAKYTPLMGACFTVKDGAILHLLKQGADEKIRNKEKKTAFDLYVKSGGKSKRVKKALFI